MIYRQSLRSTGNNLDLRLASEVGANFGAEPLTCETPGQCLMRTEEWLSSAEKKSIVSTRVVLF